MTTVHPIRAVLLVGASGSAAWWLATMTHGLITAEPTLESLVTAAVLAGGALAAAAVSLTSGLALAQSITGRTPRAADSLPLPLRRFLVGTVAAAVAAGAAIPASADEAYPGWAPTVPTASATPLAASPSPAPATPAASPAPEPSTLVPPPAAPAPHVPRVPAPGGPVVELHAESWAPALPAPEGARTHPTGVDVGATAGTAHASHVVEPGESLWSIARDSLAPGASAAEVAGAWPRIYAANRTVIGSDAGLIHPGQVLVVPWAVGA